MEPQQMESNKNEKKAKITEHYTGNAVGAVFLILLGIVFLLNNFGVLPWSMWAHIWKLWPLFLILPGLQLVLGKSKIATLIIALIGFVLISFLLLLSWAAVDTNISGWMHHNMSFLPDRTYTLFEKPDAVTKELAVTSDDYDLDTVKTRTLSLGIGVSEFTLADSANDEYLTVDAQYYDDFGVPQLTHTLRGRELDLNFTTESSSSFNFNWLSGDSVSYDFVLGQRNIPTDITIDLGTGKGTITLEKLNTTELTASVGTGDLEVTLGVLSLPADTFKLDVGTGKITLNLPKETGLKINHSVGLGELIVDSETIKNEGIYYSDNYESAETQVEVMVEVGVGTIEINLE